MTGMPKRGRRVASAALRAWEAEADEVRAEYRRLERQAPGAGDRWISTRTVILQEAREAAESASPQVRVGSGSGPGVELQRGVSNARTASGGPQPAGPRAGTREAWPLSTILGGRQ